MKWFVLISTSALAIGIILIGIFIYFKKNNTSNFLNTPSTAQASGKYKDTIGYVGCSLSVDAINGYYLEGGKKFWLPDSNYNGGTVSRWGENLSDKSVYWSTFKKLYNENPTKTIWWQICASDYLPNDNYENAVKVLDEIRKRAPGVKIYISVIPEYSDGYVCRLEGGNAHKLAQDIAKKLLEKFNYLKEGPIVGPLAQSQLRDQCHANNEGKRLMGGQLLEFFNNLK